MVFSFIASIAGIALLLTDKSMQDDPSDATDYMLLLMTFTYWLVFCAAFAAEKWILPEWETLLMSVRLTGVISYLLTAACILSLPLHRVSVRQPE